MANIQKSTDSSSLAEVISTILDKGIVIDVWATVSLVGIQILSIEARIVIASVETYLKYAEAIGLMGGTTTRALKNASMPLPTTTGATMPGVMSPGVPVPAGV
jgi:hypothetical protein